MFEIEGDLILFNRVPVARFEPSAWPSLRHEIAIALNQAAKQEGYEQGYEDGYKDGCEDAVSADAMAGE